jgi:hypothetical protein
MIIGAESIGNPGPVTFFVALALAAGLSMAIFAHAEKRGNRHATAWGIAVFLFAGAAIPLYFIRLWLRNRVG